MKKGREEREDAHDRALAGCLTKAGHRLVQRVYYEDTDFSGLVYHARYLHFLERGRTDFLRLLGVDQGALAEEAVFVVRRMAIDFRRPARMDDVLAIETAPRAARGARLALRQTIVRNEELLVEAEVEIAVLSAEGRPTRLSAALVARLSRFAGE